MFFERMGVHGLNDIEDIIFASVLTGDPLLMIGTAGAAKTKIIDKLGQALNLKTQIYNCSAINFEDIIGYMLPADQLDADGNKTMEIIRSPYSIHDVELLGLDELSRCRIDRQNDLLGVVRERMIQGADLKRLKIIFAAMNPIQQIAGDTYEGAEPLDKAFAERFPWTVVIKPFSEMDKEDKEHIISARGKGDSPALKYWSKGKVTNDTVDVEVVEDAALLRDDLYALLATGSEYLEAIERDYKEGITKYIITFCEVLGNDGLKQVSGRSAGMISRNIVSLAAIQKAMSPELPIQMEDVALKAVLHSFPDQAVNEAINETHILAAHKIAAPNLTGCISGLVLADIKRDPDLVNRVKRAMSATMDSVNFSTLIHEALEHLRETDPVRGAMFAQAVYYEIESKNLVTAHILNELARDVKKIADQESNQHMKASTLAEAAQKVILKEMKPLYDKAATENERKLLIYSSLIYGKILPDVPGLKEDEMKSFSQVHEDFRAMLKNFKGASANINIK
jgi:MoxR-like ATPase